MSRSQLDNPLHLMYLDIKLQAKGKAAVAKLQSLTGGSGVHVFLALWKAASAVRAYDENSVPELEMCGRDFAVLESLLHEGPLPGNEIGKKGPLTSGSSTVAVVGLEPKGFV